MSDHSGTQVKLVVWSVVVVGIAAAGEFATSFFSFLDLLSGTCSFSF